MGTNDTAMLAERRHCAATLYAFANLVEAGEIEVGGDMATVYHLNDGASVLDGSVSLADAKRDAGVSEVPALVMIIEALADGVMDMAYGDEGWSDDENEALEERAQLLYSLLDTNVPEIMDTIRIGSMEEVLRKQRRDEAA